MTKQLHRFTGTYAEGYPCAFRQHTPKWGYSHFKIHNLDFRVHLECSEAGFDDLDKDWDTYIKNYLFRRYNKAAYCSG